MNTKSWMTGLLGLAMLSAPASAADSVLGLWYDHTGRGAVEITDCGGKLCGKIAWLGQGVDPRGCGVQVIGNVPAKGPNVWDGGFIFDPETNGKYDVELTLVSHDKLKVLGYETVKFLGQTMMWTRAPTNLAHCK